MAPLHGLPADGTRWQRVGARRPLDAQQARGAKACMTTWLQAARRLRSQADLATSEQCDARLHSVNGSFRGWLALLSAARIAGQ